MRRTLPAALLTVLLTALGCNPNGPTVSLGSNPAQADAAAPDAVALGTVVDASESAPDARPPATDAGAIADASSVADAGAGCDLAVAPATLHLCAPPGAAVRGSVTLTNVGATACTVSSASIDGSPAFVALVAASVLAPGAQLVIEVGYSAGSATGDQAQLRIASDDADTPELAVALVGAIAGPLGCGPSTPDAGTLLPPDAGTPATLDAGTLSPPDAGTPATPCQLVATPAMLALCTPPGTPTIGSVTVQNASSAACTLLGSTLTGSAELALVPSPAPLTLGPGATTTFEVTYQPTDFSPDSATLAVLSGGSRLLVPVSAQVAGAVGCP